MEGMPHPRDASSQLSLYRSTHSAASWASFGLRKLFYLDRCPRVRGRLKARSDPQSSRKRFASGRALLFDRKRRSFLSERALVKSLPRPFNCHID